MLRRTKEKVSNSNKSRQCLETFHARNISDRIGVKSHFQIKATGFIWDKRRIVYWLNGDYRLMLPVCERIQMRARRRRRDPESRWNRYQRLCCRSGCPRIETRPCGNQTFLFASWKCGGTTIKLYPIQIGWFTSPCKPKLAVQIFSRKKCNNNKQKKGQGKASFFPSTVFAWSGKGSGINILVTRRTPSGSIGSQLSCLTPLRLKVCCRTGWEDAQFVIAAVTNRYSPL